MNRRVFRLALPGVAVLLAGWSLLAMPGQPALAQQPATEATTPEAAVVKVCAGCHGMQLVTDTPRDYDAWHDTVQKMIDRGARGTPEEFDLVMDYLFQNMTPIDVNHADAETLMAVLHTSQTAADAIVARRTSRPFKDLAELEKAIPGLDKTLLDAKKRMIFFQ
ncbi:MAG: helix-hairpin-helix domain-containing protein [Alphaproteobacteria bacterium]|nr:helix-hairpin-helix domain-containing protein [Alphaproteobacteria bacterium]